MTMDEVEQLQVDAERIGTEPARAADAGDVGVESMLAAVVERIGPRWRGTAVVEAEGDEPTVAGLQLAAVCGDERHLAGGLDRARRAATGHGDADRTCGERRQHRREPP